MGEVGHVARNCLTQRRKNPPSQVEGKDRDAPPPLLSVYTASDFYSPELQMRADLPTVRVEVGGVRKQFLVDSGAQNSLI
jgi:hypothetical protein